MNRDEVVLKLRAKGGVAGKTARPGSRDFEAAKDLDFREAGDEAYEAVGPKGGTIRIGIWEAARADGLRRISCGRK